MTLLACLYLSQLIGITQTSGWKWVILFSFFLSNDLEEKHDGYKGHVFYVCTHFPHTSGPIKLWQCTHHVLGVCLINNIMDVWMGDQSGWREVSVTYNREQAGCLEGYRSGPRMPFHPCIIQISHHALQVRASLCFPTYVGVCVCVFKSEDTFRKWGQMFGWSSHLQTLWGLRRDFNVRMRVRFRVKGWVRRWG